MHMAARQAMHTGLDWMCSMRFLGLESTLHSDLLLSGRMSRMCLLPGLASIHQVQAWCPDVCSGLPACSHYVTNADCLL